MHRILLLVLLALSSLGAADRDALSGERFRVLVSTDIGGTDPDDQQSMVHFLLYADLFDIEGIVSSPYGPGRLSHILEVIDAYERDYPNLRTWSPKYPTPAALRAVSKQGSIDGAGYPGFAEPTDGSRWIIKCARRPDPRPLWVLVWGGIDDLAQALHDAPDILPKLRVYFIGGPNKMWSANAYAYIERNHPNLWIIESNATYRGWFTGGNQTGEWSNTAFVKSSIAGRAALGTYFGGLLKGSMKMGDTPSVGYLLRGTPSDPTRPGWGGRYVRIWDNRTTIFRRLTTEADEVEVFGTVEFALPLPAGMTNQHKVTVSFDNRVAVPARNDGKTLRFRFSPRDAKVWTYKIQSDFPALNGATGAFRATPPPTARTSRPSTVHPNWWIDTPEPAEAEGVHPGAKTVSRWREGFLRDFAERMQRAEHPRTSGNLPVR